MVVCGHIAGDCSLGVNYVTIVIGIECWRTILLYTLSVSSNTILNKTSFVLSNQGVD